ncbi:AI-2E family transporter [Ekhidna sp.]
MKESEGSIVTSTLSQTSTIFSGALMSFVYTFLLLIYRGGLKQVAQRFAKKNNKELVGKMLGEMQKVGQSYLFGMGIMISILGVANTIILLLFGLDNAIFFGFLAALLAIIPYVGTTIGAAIPIIYALMTNDSLWTPIGIMISFWAVQVVESNYLSPKIVGGNLNVNALAAIVSLIIGNSLWGVAGMALFLPFTAIFRVFCSYHRPLKSISLLLDEKLKV